MIEEAHKLLFSYMRTVMGTSSLALIINNLEKGASDKVLQELLSMAQEIETKDPGYMDLMTALSGILSQRSRKGEDRDFQKDVLRELGLVRQQLEFMGSLIMLAVQNAGFKFEGEAPTPQQAPPEAGPSPGMPSGYNLYKKSEKSS